MGDEAVEIVDHGAAADGILLTCEHASGDLHRRPWGADAWLEDTHWAVDLGIEALTRALAERLRTQAALARFSRLLIDANRPLGAPTLFRDHAEGRPVQLNTELPPDEQAHRVARWWRPYHAAVDGMLASSPGRLLVSMHSFTPVYEGDTREVEIGVLYDRDEAEALRLAGLLEGAGFTVRLNEPYSGRGGMMFSCQAHATRHGMRGLELELRQDLLADGPTRAELTALVGDALQRLVG